jgi:hypothetical protein
MYLAKAKTEYIASNSRFVGIRKKRAKMGREYKEI